MHHLSSSLNFLRSQQSELLVFLQVEEVALHLNQTFAILDEMNFIFIIIR